MTVLYLSEKHVPEMISLHQEALASDLLPSLGRRFLSILHREFVNSADTITIGSLENKTLSGFVVGCKNTSQFMRSVILRRWHTVLPILMVRCLTRPRLIKYLLQTLSYGKKANAPAAELLIIVVSKRWRKQGLGTRLFKTLVKQFKSARIKEFTIGTRADMSTSNHFYLKLGGKFSHSTYLYDQLWNYYNFNTKS